ncbi:MAG: hypothetical protein Q9213_001336 [Squamulea squamosa]
MRFNTIIAFAGVVGMIDALDIPRTPEEAAYYERCPGYRLPADPNNYDPKVDTSGPLNCLGAPCCEFSKQCIFTATSGIRDVQNVMGAQVVGDLVGGGEDAVCVETKRGRIAKAALGVDGYKVAYCQTLVAPSKPYFEEATIECLKTATREDVVDGYIDKASLKDRERCEKRCGTDIEYETVQDCYLKCFRAVNNARGICVGSEVQMTFN